MCSHGLLTVLYFSLQFDSHASRIPLPITNFGRGHASRGRLPNWLTGLKKTRKSACRSPKPPTDVSQHFQVAMEQYFREIWLNSSSDFQWTSSLWRQKPSCLVVGLLDRFPVPRSTVCSHLFPPTSSASMSSRVSARLFSEVRGSTADCIVACYLRPQPLRWYATAVEAQKKRRPRRKGPVEVGYSTLCQAVLVF
jgi:hypothetical protein